MMMYSLLIRHAKIYEKSGFGPLDKSIYLFIYILFSTVPFSTWIAL